jgi:hypothetical protein
MLRCCLLRHRLFQIQIDFADDRRSKVIAVRHVHLNRSFQEEWYMFSKFGCFDEICEAVCQDKLPQSGLRVQPGARAPGIDLQAFKATE